MPLKNMEAFISETIDSILDQTYTSWELHIVDDHSEDKTWEIIQYFNTDTRIYCHKNSGNGIIPALKEAFTHCKGSFITRMDGDDLMPKNRLGLMAEALSDSHEKTLVTGKVKYFSDAPISQGYLNYEKWLNERVELSDHWQWIYRECVVASPNWMMRTEELRAIGGFDDLVYPEDYDLMFRCYQNAFTIKSLNDITLHWREHPERTSRNSKHYQQESFFRLKISRFLALQEKNKPLFLIGTMRKGKLAARILLQNEVDFQWFDRTEEPNRKKIYNHELQHVELLPKNSAGNALIAVFPEGKAKEQLEYFLSQSGFEFGYNCWYL